MRKTTLLILVMMLVLNVFAQTNGEYFFKFTYNNQSQLKHAIKLVSVDKVDKTIAYAYANEKQFEAFRSLGFEFEILPNPSTLFVPKMASSKDEMKDWDSYPTYETYVNMMNQFAIDYPDLCVVENIGQTVEGRDLLFVKISDNVATEEAEPEFMYTGTMHGDETTGYVLLLRLADYLLSNYGTDDRVTTLVDNMEIWINPAANPDGTYAGGNNTVFGATRVNGNGIDINRNFKDGEVGDHPDGNAWQPETIAMMDLAWDHNFVLSANYHGGTEVVNYPWDMWEDRHADDNWWQEVSHEYADACHDFAPSDYMNEYNNGITNGYDWYSVNGGRQDFMNWFRGCREFTVEISDTKLLPESQLDAHWTYNKEAMLLYMENCLEGIHGTVVDADGNPLEATIYVLDHDFDNSQVYTDTDFGDFYRLIASGTYDLQIESYGYISQVVNDVVVTAGEVTTVDVILEQAEVITVTGTVTDSETGNPLAGATIQVMDTPINSVTTNADGEYTIENVLEGIYDFRCSLIDYASVIQNVAVTADNNVVDFQLTESNAWSFETGVFSSDWDFSGNDDWTIVNNQSYDGTYSAKSGDITDNQATSMEISLTILSAGEISFFKKVSSESGYDYMHFYIDGTEQDEWSGDIDWSEESFAVTAGNHTFTWEYTKDGSVGNGDDCAWIDYIIFPPYDESGNHAPIFTSTPVINAQEDVLYTYNVTAVDEDGNDLTISATVLPDWLTLTDNTDGTATLSGTPAVSDVGNHNVEITVTDGIVSAEQTFTITVEGNPNQAPVFTSTPVLTATVGEAYVYELSATDAEGDELTFALATAPDWLMLQTLGDNTFISGTPEVSQLGEHSIVITVTDGTSTTEQDYTLTVEGDTYEVTFNVDVSNIEIVEGDVFYIAGSFNGWAEPGTDENSLLSDDDENGIYTVTLSIAEGSYEYKYFKNTGWNGGEWEGGVNRVIEVTTDTQIDDIWGGMDFHFITSPELIVAFNEQYTYNVQVAYNSGDVTFTSETLPAWLTLTGNGYEATLEGIPSTDDEGDYVITIIATDDNTSIEQTFTLTVTDDSGIITNSYNNEFFTVFPNPVKEELFVEFTNILNEKTEVSVINVLGKIMKTKSFESGQNSIRMNIENLESGIYFVKISSGNQMFTNKIMKK